MEREEVIEPMSPIDQFFSTSIFTVSVIAVMESEIPLSLDETQACQFIRESFLPLNPRFSSIMVMAKYFHGALKNTSMVISNMIGPIEQMSFVDHPIKGLCFLMTGVPQSLVMGVVSYNGRLRICALMEKDFMDPNKFKLYVEHALDLIYEAACKS